MKRIVKHLVAIIALILLAIPSFGWGRRVHSAIAYIADRATRRQIKEIQAGDPYDWGQDIIDRTNHVWTVREGDKLTFSYIRDHRELALDQIQRAGLRLAKVMNDLFK